MRFHQATDIATGCLTLEQIGKALGVTWIRQCRLEPSASSYRRPPSGWELRLAQLVRERVFQLEQLATELERKDSGQAEPH